MIYVENTSNYPQRVYIPRDEGNADDTRGYQFQKKDLDINHNGDYYLFPDSGYDGITASTIHVEVPTDTQEAYDQGYQDGYAAGYASGSTDGYASGHTDGYAEGYSSGHTDGYAEGYASGHTDGYAEGYAAGYEAGFAAGAADQKAKLTQLTATTNGHYTAEDGYSDVYVNVEGGGDYSSGYTDGMAAQKALLTSTTFTDNGHFEREDGWNAIDVRLNLPSLHTAITENGRVVYLPPAGAKGFDSVEIDVNVPQTGGTAVLTALTVTENGSYTPSQGVDGFSAVTVNVPITGETYPRSNVTLELISDDYDGLSGMTIHFDATNGSQASAFTVVDSSTTIFTAVFNPGVPFHIYATTPIGYQGAIDVWDTTYWNEDKYYQANIMRYETGVTTTVTAKTYSQSASVFPSDDMRALVYDGASSALTGPSNATYDAGEDKWYIDYPGTIVKGFYFKNGSTLRNDLIGLETPSTLSGIGGLSYASKLEYVYGEGIAEIGDCRSDAAPGDAWTGFEGCTALTDVTSQVQLKKVGYAAFQDCTALTNFNNSNFSSIEFLGRDAFMNCVSLSGAVSLDSIDVVPYQAFYGCTGITNMYFGPNCTYIDTYAFRNCTSLNFIWAWPTTAPGLSSVGNPFSGVASPGTLFIRDGSDYSTWVAKLPADWSIGYFS